MKFFFVLAALLITGNAQAQNYLCTDGTRITRDSQARTIHVTIDGTQLTCTLTASSPGPAMCSASSENVCVNQRSAWGDCKTKFNEYGKCMAQDTVGADGNPVCGCGVGE